MQMCSSSEIKTASSAYGILLQGIYPLIAEHSLLVYRILNRYSTCLRNLQHDIIPVTCLVLVGRETLIASYASGLIQVINLTTDVVIRRLEGHQAFIHQLIYNDRNSTLASASEDSTAKLWNFITGRCLATFPGHQEIINRITWLDNGKFLATSDRAGAIRIWSIEDR